MLLFVLPDWSVTSASTCWPAALKTSCLIVLYICTKTCVCLRVCVCVCTVIVYITVEGAKDYFAGDHFVLLR